MSAYSVQNTMLLCLSLASVFSCSSSAEEHQECYGSIYQFPSLYSPFLISGQLIFTPSNGGEKKIVIQNRKVQDPRFTEGAGLRLLMRDLTEQDDGVFSVSYDDDGRPIPVITLVIEDCSDPEKKYYGGVFSVRVPDRAAFLEFTPAQSLDLVTVIWNRTDPLRSRGSVNRNYWEMTGITQEHSGYYKFRAKDNKLLEWRKLEVNEHEKWHVRDEGKDIYIKYPDESNRWTIIFVRGVNRYTLLKGGTNQMSGPFSDRLQFVEDAIIIDPLQYEDSGTFEFRDAEDNLAQRVELDVKTGFPAPLYYVIIAGSLFLVFVIYCCVKRGCCKKSSSKRNNAQPQAAPAVHYLNTTQPTGPSQSTASPAPVYSYQPTSTTDGPPAAAPGGQGATPLLSKGSDFTSMSSDWDPQFDIKGISLASAPPLNSDTTISDVYTSDKLNFL